MALMDAYGLSLMAVESWGILLGITSFSFMIGGIVVTKFGLGKNPVRTILVLNIIAWIAAALFTIQASVVLLFLGMVVWMAISPAVEAAEATVLQKVVPLERQGRVVGFSQSLEQATGPFVAFMIGPLTQFIFIPFMTTGKGVELLGPWFGVGDNRGIALVFVVAGCIGIIATFGAFFSKSYAYLKASYVA